MRQCLRLLILSASLTTYLLGHVSQGQTNTFQAVSSARNASSNTVSCKDTGSYINSQGQKVKRPENCSGAPPGATAQCRNGSYSFSRNHRGTCSHHGGVAKWL